MNYSPKLKKAAAEIKDILEKYDIAAIVTLHTPGAGEYLFHITPSYSCAQIDNTTGMVRIKATKAELGYEKRNKMLTDTSNMLSILGELTGMNYQNLHKLSDLVDRHTGAEHGDSNQSSNQSQNN